MEESLISKFCQDYRCINSVYTHSVKGDSFPEMDKYYDVHYYHNRRIDEWELCRYLDENSCHPNEDGDDDEDEFGGKG